MHNNVCTAEKRTKRIGILLLPLAVQTLIHLYINIATVICLCLNKPAQVFVISYLLFWPAFFWMKKIFEGEKFSWLPSKNKVADKNLHFQRHTNFLYNVQLFISHFCFRRQYYKKCVKWKQVKIKNMILQSLKSVPSVTVFWFSDKIMLQLCTISSHAILVSEDNFY